MGLITHVIRHSYELLCFKAKPYDLMHSVWLFISLILIKFSYDYYTIKYQIKPALLKIASINKDYGYFEHCIQIFITYAWLLVFLYIFKKANRFIQAASNFTLISILQSFLLYGILFNLRDYVYNLYPLIFSNILVLILIWFLMVQIMVIKETFEFTFIQSILFGIILISCIFLSLDLIA